MKLLEETSEERRIRIGKRIRDIRSFYEISIEELAEMLDLSTAFVGLIERGQRGTSVKNIIKIADIFETSTDNLLIEGIPEDEYKKMYVKKICILLNGLCDKDLEFLIDFIRTFRQYRLINNEFGEKENRELLMGVEVEFLQELISGYMFNKGAKISVKFEDDLNFGTEINMYAVKALENIKKILENDKLNDFECIEQIQVLFENDLKIGISYRHDFG